MATKPRVLVLGGLGFLGKNIVDYIVKNDLASKVRVVDKIMTAMARLTPEEESLFNQVECIQANLCKPESAAKSFTDAEGDYDIVINLASVTKPAQEDEVYKQGITDVAVTIAKEALKHKTEKFLEISTTEVYASSSKAVNETGELKPATAIGKAKLESEQQLAAMSGLPLIIVRPATVYGPGDINGLAPNLCIGSVYQKIGKKLEFPQWFEETKFPTVHIADLVAAIWHLAVNGTVGKTYNIADKNETDFKKINQILEKIFGIKTGHFNLAKSEVSKLIKTEDIVSEINGEHGMVWLKLVEEKKLEYSPLSPYLDADKLSGNSLAVDGSAIESSGFSYKNPQVTEELVRAQIEYYVKEKWFPSP